jgi:hypothetical protein
MNLARGDAYSLIQAVTEIILLPIAIFGFIWTAREVSNALAPVVLTLGWDNRGRGTPSRHIELMVDEDPEFSRSGQTICLYNSGKAMSRWFLIEMMIPLELCIFNSEYESIELESWGSSGATEGGAWQVESLGKNLKVVFTSNGTVASYPSVRLQLGTIWHESNGLTLGQFVIPFTIHSDRGKPKHSQLTVNVEGIFG